MKTYAEYCKEYDKVIREGIAKGHTMALRQDYYVAFHFLEDNGITEPWADDAAEKLNAAIEKCSPADKHNFLFVIKTLMDTFTKGE